jgi:hypothetical protein
MAISPFVLITRGYSPRYLKAQPIMRINTSCLTVSNRRRHHPMVPKDKNKRPMVALAITKVIS